MLQRPLERTLALLHRLLNVVEGKAANTAYMPKMNASSVKSDICQACYRNAASKSFGSKFEKHGDLRIQCVPGVPEVTLQKFGGDVKRPVAACKLLQGAQQGRGYQCDVVREASSSAHNAERDDGGDVFANNSANSGAFGPSRQSANQMGLHCSKVVRSLQKLIVIPAVSVIRFMRRKQCRLSFCGPPVSLFACCRYFHPVGAAIKIQLESPGAG